MADERDRIRRGGRSTSRPRSCGAAGRVVIDRTGLTRIFDFELRWAQDPTDTTRPSIFTALQEQLGLKLESTRGPVDVLVIDHVERPAPD